MKKIYNVQEKIEHSSFTLETAKWLLGDEWTFILIFKPQEYLKVLRKTDDLNIYNSMTTGKTTYKEEDCVIESKAPE